MNIKIRLLLLAVIAITLLSGCALSEHLPANTIRDRGAEFDALSQSRSMRVVQEAYLGATPMELKSDAGPVLQTHVTLRFSGTLSELTDVISGLVPVVVNLEGIDPGRSGSAAPRPSGPASAPAQPPSGPASAPAQPPSGSEVDPGLEALLASAGSPSSAIRSGTAGPQVRINYAGPLRGLFTQISTQSGFGWDYDRNTNTVTFASMMVRTFTLTAAPGEIEYDNQITNRSRESQGSRSIGGQQTVSTETTSAQTNQTNRNRLTHDIWKDTEESVKSMLSSGGQVTANRAAGTLTVRDKPENVRQIAVFIDEVNGRFGRQVALRVNVWALELTNEVDAGVDLQAIFQGGSLSVISGALNVLPGSMNTAAATVVSGDLKDSTAILRALRRWGQVSQVTSGGAIVMNNQPAPILNTTTHAYLAGMATSLSESGNAQTVELTPGEVTTGFSMTVIPHIMENRQVILNYTINLSSLDQMANLEAGGTTIQLPQVSTRAFSQRVSMRMGQTLVLAGFARSEQTRNTSSGLFSLGRGGKNAQTMLIVTIEVENASPELQGV